MVGCRCFALILALLPTPRALAEAAKPDPGVDASDLDALLQEGVVTTASRASERASIAPATVYSITAEEMQRAGARTVAEALNFLGLGLWVNAPRDYTSGEDIGGQGIMLRDSGAHVLVMLDGHLLNSQGTGQAAVNEALGVPMLAIDHVEVMLGPGSVMFGSNAMLAVINVVTRAPKDAPGLSAAVEAGTAVPQDTQGDPTGRGAARWGERSQVSLGGGASFSLAGHEGHLRLTADLIQENGSTFQVPQLTSANPSGDQSFPATGPHLWGGTASRQLFAPSALAVATAGNFRLELSASDYQQNMPLVGLFSDPAALEEQQGVRLDARHTADLSARLALTSRLYADYTSFSETSDYGDAFLCISGQDLGCRFTMSASSLWAGLEQQLSADWFLDGAALTRGGYNLRVREYRSDPADYRDASTGQLSSLVPRPHAANTSVVGALFAEQVWRPARFLSFNLGARLDLDSQFGAALSPRAAIVFTPVDGTTARLSYNQAFRAPTEWELTNFDPTYRIPPRSLKSETVKSVEAEVQQRLGRLSVSVRAYAAWYSDFIENRPATLAEVQPYLSMLSPTVDPSTVVVYDNLTALRALGGSATLQWKLPAGFSLAGSYSYARTTDSSGAVDQRLPLWYGNARLGWESSSEGYAVNLAARYAAPVELTLSGIPAGDGDLGPQLDLRLTCSGRLPTRAPLRWRASLGFSANPDLPDEVTDQLNGGTSYLLHPVESRLFGFVGIEYRP